MERYSVKKPFTVLVGIIVIIALGAVSLMNLSMDLLPEISLPYMIVITTYPGAGPEKVEAMVTEPMENALGKLSGVKSISSTSSDNYSMIQLEFEDGTNLDSAMVKLSSAINQLESSLPDGVGTPSIMSISMDMLATMYVAVERDGYDIYELSDFVNNDVIPYISRQEGVASVSTVGLVEQTVQVELNQDKIDAINDLILQATNDALDEAEEQLAEAQAEIDESQEALESAQSSYGETVSSAIFDQLDEVVESTKQDIQESLVNLVESLEATKEELEDSKDTVDDTFNSAESSISSLVTTLDYAVEIGEALTSDEVTALVDSITNAVNGESSTDYSSYANDVVSASVTLIEARLIYGEDSEEASAASEAYDASIDALWAALYNDADLSSDQVTSAINDIDTIITALDSSSSSISSSSVSSLISSTSSLSDTLTSVSSLITTIEEYDLIDTFSSTLSTLSSSLDYVNAIIDQLPELIDYAESMYSTITQTQLDTSVTISTASVQLSTAQSTLDSAQSEYDSARESAIDSANADALLTTSTLSSIIYAQNFAMPAGYIDDENDNSWLLKIGDEFDTEESISQLLLLENDTVGIIRLEDVADITIIDNAAESYAKLNGSESVILSIFKASTAGTNDVSRACNKAFSEMESNFPGMDSVVLVDQGVYISMIVESIFSSIGLGALLAIVILALFLKDVKPTIVVAISIPLSVLLALVLLYFSDLDLNMMTLSGLSLGIGMLVDNSVVVMENILRLRNQGIPAARAAVQGAKQVKGSIIASTLTTICVFLPIVFANGTVRTLLYPLALSIGYCLVASLVMSLTVVPASCSTILNKTAPKESKFFTMIQNAYGKSLRWCLKFKVVPLVLSITLLVVSVLSMLKMGIVYIPEMTSNEINATITTPEELTREESYAMVDEIMASLLKIDGVEDLGIMDAGSSRNMLASTSSSSGRYGSYMVYIVAPKNATADDVDRITSSVEAAIIAGGAEAEVAGGGMSDLSALGGGSGVSIQIQGNNLDTLHRIATEVGEILANQEGLIDVNDGSEDNEPALHLVIDRDLAMSYGLTTAQIYAQIAENLSTSVTATTVTINDMDMTVVIDDRTSPLTRENLMDMEFDSDSSYSTDDSSSENTVHKLSEFAELVETVSESSISRENLSRYMNVTAATAPGYNTTLVSRELVPKINEYAKTLPSGYQISVGGETTQVNEMISQMLQMAALALLFIYVIMVAQFQSLLSPFIILFTIPLAFTGGMFGLMIAGQQLSILSILGFVILMGTVVNNGIVFVDYANQLRIGGMERRDALVATGITRMRPILMTALTTILAMSQMIFGSGMASQLGSGMSIVIAGGLLYATLMTLYIVPIIYDILFKRPPLNVDVGDDEIDAELDDAAQFLASMNA